MSDMCVSELNLMHRCDPFMRFGRLSKDIYREEQGNYSKATPHILKATTHISALTS